jgi:hypothetical protein
LLVPELAGVIAFIVPFVLFVLFGAAKVCLTLVRPAFVADLYGPGHSASIAGVPAFAVTAALVPARRTTQSVGTTRSSRRLLWLSALASLCLLAARPAANESG